MSFCLQFEVPTVFLVMDKTPSGRIVAQAQACDADGPDNKNMFYYLYTGNNLCKSVLICRVSCYTVMKVDP